MMEFLTGLLVVLTGVYAWLTLKISRANQDSAEVMRNQLREATRPVVTFELIPDGHLVSGLIRNRGASCAYEVKLRVSPDFKIQLSGGWRDSVLFTKVIASLTPTDSIEEFFGDLKEIKGQIGAVTLVGEVEYLDASGFKYVDKILTSLEARSVTPHLNRSTQIAELKRIADSLEKLASTQQQLLAALTRKEN
jgi:hypothetical protein